MKRTTCAAAMLLTLGGIARAEPTPLCQRPEVLQEVARTLRQWNVYNSIDIYSVSEAPTTQANAVVCHAAVDGIGYIQTASGWTSRRTRVVCRYDVQVSGNRFAVQVSR